MTVPPLTSWHAQRSAGDGGTRVFNREWRAHGDEAEAHVTRLLSEDQVAVIRRSKRPNRALAQQFGVSIWTIGNVRAGNTEGTPAPFVPLCMEPDELETWREKNDSTGPGRARTPCQDCLLDYALEMRAIGKCNGTPGAAADVEDEEPDVTPAERRPMATVKVTVTAPCETCVHAAVCARRESIIVIQQGDLAVEHSPLRGGLTLALSATIDCDAYLRVKTSHHKASMASVDADGRNPLTGRRPQSLEQRQASSERMKALRAAQRAAADVDGGVTAAGSAG